MGEKDILEKKLLMFNDVFADFVNGIVFGGRQIVKESELFDLPGWSHYLDDDSIHRYQERDVVKLWKKEKVVISLIGIENQEVPDEDMVFRVLSYDGASYKTQLTKKDRLRKKSLQAKKVQLQIEDKSDLTTSSYIYPVITFVIYYGEKDWNHEITLKKSLKIGDELDTFVSDYKINLIDLKKLTEDDINMFKKDFKLLADFMVKGSNHNSETIELNHPEEVSELVLRLTGEELTIPTKDKEGGETMEKFFEPMFARAEAKARAKGEAEGRAKGEAEGRAEGRAEGIVEGRAEGIVEGRAEGIVEGQALGKVEGENRIIRLISFLMSEGRNETVKEILENTELRNRLCREYGI